MNEDNPEAIPERGDALETTRGTSDWSLIQEEYAEPGATLLGLARRYGVRECDVRAELARLDIPVHPRGPWPGAEAAAANRARAAQRKSGNRWGNPVNSPLERLLQGALLKAGIGFETQRRLLKHYVVDVLLFQVPVIVEADGAVHKLAHVAAKDIRRDADLTAAGYRVFRFDGGRLNRDPDSCVAEIISAMGLVPDQPPVVEIRNGMIGPNSPSWTGGRQPFPCLQCGTEYLTYPAYRESGRSKFCGRACQVRWQRETGASVRYRRSNSERMRALWNDPQWRAWILGRRHGKRWPKSDGEIVRSGQ